MTHVITQHMISVSEDQSYPAFVTQLIDGTYAAEMPSMGVSVTGLNPLSALHRLITGLEKEQRS